MEPYDAHAIEQKWQSIWDAEGAFHVDNPAPGAAQVDRHFYMLEMLPYPSGSLHMGHVLNYTLGDVVTHFKRRHGFTVLRPMGFDSFGLPAENAAIKDGGHPLEITERNMAAIRNQMRRIWTRIASMLRSVISSGWPPSLIAAFSAGRPNESKPIGRSTLNPLRRLKCVRTSPSV